MSTTKTQIQQPAGGKHAAPKSEPAEVQVVKPEERTIAKPTASSLVTSLEDPLGAPAEDRGFAGGTPYLGHYGEKARKATREPLDAAGVKAGEFYLFLAGTPIRLEGDGRKAEIHVLKVTRLFTRQDQAMNITDARLSGNRETFKEGYREHLFAVVAVRLPDYGDDGKPTGKLAALIPATLNLRGGQTQALDKALQLGKVAQNDVAWKALGPNFRESVGAKHPGGRFIATIWSTAEDLDDGTDNTFNKGHGVCRPTPKDDVEFFNNWYDANQSAIAAVTSVIAGRVDEAKKKLRE